MTIRKRLIFSNILMIAVPVIATALIGILCVGVIWFSILSGSGLNLEDTEDYNRVCLAVAETMEHKMNHGGDLSSLEDLLESNEMTVRIYRGDQELYFYGTEDKNDADLMQAADVLSAGSCVVSQNGRSLFRTEKTINGAEVTICISGGNHSEGSYDQLKMALKVSVGLLLITILLSVFFTNRFLTRFVIRRIEGALNVLTDGVHEIRDGNLEFRIQYDRPDEFKPVCEDFNEMAARLKASVEKQQRQELSRKELLAGISHDIRSPLTSIQAYVEGLLDGIAKTPEARRGYLLTIKTKAEDLDHMVSQLFLFSKMELGEYSESVCSLRLDEKIEACTSEARAEFADHGMQIETELEAVIVRADPIQLDRVINNIMSNSLKYKNKEKGLMRISLTQQEERCRLIFEDDGPGVPAEALPHLFEVFYRSDPARQDPQKGSGLGLAIAERIIVHAGGTICAKESALGGLKIEILLPCGKGEENGEHSDH